MLLVAIKPNVSLHVDLTYRYLPFIEDNMTSSPFLRIYLRCCLLKYTRYDLPVSVNFTVIFFEPPSCVLATYLTVDILHCGEKSVPVLYRCFI
jgi:hypothetical protein